MRRSHGIDLGILFRLTYIAYLRVALTPSVSTVRFEIIIGPKGRV